MKFFSSSYDREHVPHIQQIVSQEKNVMSPSKYGSENTPLLQSRKRGSKSMYLYGCGFMVWNIMIILTIALFLRNLHSSLPIFSYHNSDKEESNDDKHVCKNKDYLQTTTKTLIEATFGGLMADTRYIQNGFEATGVAYDDVNDVFFVSFATDTSYGSVGIIDNSFIRSYYNILVESGNNIYYSNEINIGFKSISLDRDDGSIFLMTAPIERESSEEYLSRVVHVSSDNISAYSGMNSCVLPFGFTADSNGFSGLSVISQYEALSFENETIIELKSKYLIALCEDNYCGSQQSSDKHHSSHKHSANGRMIIFNATPNLMGADCEYPLIGEVDLPTSVAFSQYSDLDFYISSDRSYKVGIISREDTSLWIGYFDVETLHFSEPLTDADSGQIYSYPRNINCQTQYCNIEGMAFMGENTFVAVSGDATQLKGSKRGYLCSEKDESIHIFQIPSF